MSDASPPLIRLAVLPVILDLRRFPWFGTISVCGLRRVFAPRGLVAFVGEVPEIDARETRGDCRAACMSSYSTVYSSPKTKNILFWFSEFEDDDKGIGKTRDAAGQENG